MNLKLHTSRCDPARLESFLRGDLSEREQDELALHLDGCEDCRRVLEQHAAEPDAWREAEELLRPLEFDCRDDEELPDAQTQQHRRPLLIQNVIDALGPTDDPAMLGRLGGYEVSGVVGAGGMGVVLKAVDKSLDRTVAIKVLAPHLATSGAARKRFGREAKAAAAVLHPNVIAIHSVSNDEALPYLVMPYMRGASLQKRLDAEGPLSLSESLRIGAQVAAGLAAAHAQGLVHRDIKPANILLEEGTERVTITDFGLARAIDDATITHTGAIAGTPQYMSPEQARGEPVDQRSDLFSLGSVLYALCTGRAPFRAETSYGVLRRITDDLPRPIREINSDIPEWLCGIIARLMAKQPADRIQSAGEAAELLEQCLAHVQQPTTVPLPRAAALPHQPDRASGRFGRKPGASARRLIAGGLVALAALFAGVVIVLELNKGTLTIESDSDDVALKITQGDEVVEKLTVTRGTNNVRIAAGKYVVDIDGNADGITVENGNVTIERRGAKVVRVFRRDAADMAATERIEMAVNTTRVLTLKQPIPRAQVDDNDIVELTALSPKEFQVVAKKPGVTKINLWNENNQKQTYDVVVLPSRKGEISAKQIATEVAEQIANLKSKYPQLKNFSAEQHLRKNTMHDGYNPGSPNNPELYSISYQNGVLSSIPPPTGGPRRATEFNYDPETGIQLNIHFFKGESRGNDLSPAYRLGDLGIHLYVKGPAAEPIRREISEGLEKLGARLVPWAQVVEPLPVGPTPALPPQPSEADRGTGDPRAPFSPTKPALIDQNPGTSIEPAAGQEIRDLAWGEASNGLQAGIAFAGGEKRDYSVGEDVAIAVRIRNISKEPKTMSYSSARLHFTRPQIEGPTGERVQVFMPPFVRYIIPTETTSLDPGKEMSFGIVKLKLAAERPAALVGTPHIVASAGEYRITYAVPLTSPGALVTGTLRFRITDEKPGSSEKGPSGASQSNPASEVNSQKEQFSEAKELVLSMDSSQFMLDLDTGKTMDPPATIRPEQGKMDLSTTQVQPYHYPTGLIGHSLQGVEVKASDWDASVADVRRALAGTIYELKQMDVGPEKNPTYFFKTRDGTEGILQLLQVTDNPKGIRLRFKTLPRGQKVHGEAHMALPTTGSAQHANKSNFEHGSGLELRLAYTEPAEGRIEVASPGGKTSVYVEHEPIATSVDVANVEVVDDPAGQPAIQVTFMDDAAARISEATAQHRGKPVAILFNGMLLSAPTIQEPIGNKAVITGRYNTADVTRLLNAIIKGRRMRQFKTEQGVQNINISPDGKLIAVVSGNPTLILQANGTSRVKGDWKPTVEVLDAETGARRTSLQLVTAEEQAALAATPRISHVEATSLAFSPNGSLLAVGTNIGQVKLFKTSNGELSQAFDDREARLADKETPESWKEIARAMGSVRSIAFSPDGNLLAVCGQSFAEFTDLFDGIERGGLPVTGPGRLKVWDIQRATLKHDLVGHSQVFATAFSADGSMLASAGRWDGGLNHDNGVIVWNPESGEKMRTLVINANGGTHSIAFAPNKKLLVAASRVFDKENDTSKTLITLAYPASGITEWQQSVGGWAKPAFMPSGNAIAVLAAGKSVRFLDTETGSLKHEITLDSSRVLRWNDFALSPRAALLAVGGIDKDEKGSVGVWDLNGALAPHDSAPQRKTEINAANKSRDKASF